MKQVITTLLIIFTLLLSTSLTIVAQNEIPFINKVSFSKTKPMSGVRLVALIPAPITNEYQDITSLTVNKGSIIDTNGANKVLLYDGSFEDDTIDISESFIYKTKKVRIDFNDKSTKNICTGINPDEYLGSDGKYIDLSNNTIKQVGDKLWSESDNALDYAKHCYEYVATHYKYIKGSWRTLAEIIRIGGGGCGDYTTLFVNLMRYKGIPARHNIGIWTNGGYHVWPDFYLSDYGWVPVDPTFKNANPNEDYFGRYDGNLIIVSQGLTFFSKSDIKLNNVPLQSFNYWYWYKKGYGNINGMHKPSKAN